ncbi:MAG: DUF2384 domain-containing protein [Pseudorhodoplanes sp.]|jgi:hypothetical protein|nr:DUF2384 domain-containing protein [Pseudorhodoplanes sp.]
MAQQFYPIIDEVLQPADLSDASVRERLSPVAIHAFFAVMQTWKTGDDDARALLGNIPREDYDELRTLPRRILDADALTRISCLVGIYKALNILYSEELANAWVRLPSSNQHFDRQSPITYMIKGGWPAMQTVRRLLDAVREGA